MKNTIMLLLLAVLVISCGSSREVSRIDVDTTIDLSGRWNDADARMVSQEMVSDCLLRPWLSDFNIAESRKPAVIVGTIRNKSDEHIDTETFTASFEMELTNSGKVKFVANNLQRDEIRDERDDQQEYSSDETVKRFGEETGADFMLQGSIKTIVDQIEGRKIVYYQTDMELVHIESNEKVWIGTKKIKKDISQRGQKW